ncbi:hypothetical protein ACJX0J_026222, partial [Zea mays]
AKNVRPYNILINYYYAICMVKLLRAPTTISCLKPNVPKQEALSNSRHSSKHNMGTNQNTKDIITIWLIIHHMWKIIQPPKYQIDFLQEASLDVGGIQQLQEIVFSYEKVYVELMPPFFLDIWMII